MINNSFANAVTNEVAGIESLLARLETALEEHDLKTQQKLEEQLIMATIQYPSEPINDYIESVRIELQNEIESGIINPLIYENGEVGCWNLRHYFGCLIRDKFNVTYEAARDYYIAYRDDYMSNWIAKL